MTARLQGDILKGMSNAITMNRKKSKQGRLGLLAEEYSVCWGWGNAHVAVFQAGTLCELADNLPAREDGKRWYWIKGKPSVHSLNKSNCPREDFDSWHETYGFKVEPELVASRRTHKKA